MLTISVVSFCWIFLKQSIAQNFYCVWTTLHLTPHLQRKGEDTKITSGGSYFLYLLWSSSEATTNQVCLTKLELLIGSFSGGSTRDTMGASGGRHASTFCQTHNDVCLSFCFLSLCMTVCLLALFTFSFSPFHLEGKQTDCCKMTDEGAF